MSQPIATMQLTVNDMQILSSMIAAAKQGMQAELSGKLPDRPAPDAPRAKLLAEAIVVADKWLSASGLAGQPPINKIVT